MPTAPTDTHPPTVMMRFVLAAVLLVAACGAEPETPSPIAGVEPVAGMAAELRQLYRIDLMPDYRAGSRVAQVSSYDTTGGNQDGFSGEYSFVRREGDALVVAELEGPGVVHRIWTPTPTDRMVAFYFDEEAEPRLRLRFIDLFSGEVEPFIAPLAGNEVGGYYSYVPIPYARSLRIVYEGDDLRFHQFQYRQYPPGTEVESFRLPVDPEAAGELERAREAWATVGARPFNLADAEVTEHRFELPPGSRIEFFDVWRGGRIVGIELQRDAGPDPWDASVVIDARWESDQEPAIRAPVNDFFGYAFGHPSAQGLLLGSRDGTDYVYLPMPFDDSATLSLDNLETGSQSVSGTVRVFHTWQARDPRREGRLYASWRREIEPAEGEPYRLLRAEGRGHHVGTLLQAQGLDPGMTAFFEGDDVTRIDGEMRLHGTGSEDYFNGGWYALLDRWDRDVSLPVHGSLAYSLPLSRTGGYRFYLGDKVTFEDSISVTIEHGPAGDLVPVDYASVAFYYGEAPPLDAVDPSAVAEPARTPAEHMFYPQLILFSVGGGTAVRYVAGNLEVGADAGREGLLRIDVSEVPAGRYRVLLSYRTAPDAPAFSVWRRQARVTDWIDASGTDALVERAEMGEVELTDQVRSITIRTRSDAPGRTFRLNRLVLQKLE